MDTNKLDITDEDNAFKPSYEKASKAVAISYDRDTNPNPFISSIGSNEKAEAIVKMAKELGIYVHKDPELLDELSKLKEGEQVPEELFEIIAIMLSFSYYLQGKTPEVYTTKDGTKKVNTSV